MDKKHHKYESFTSIPTNFSIVGCLENASSSLDLESESKNLLKRVRKCEKHPHETLKFYCKTH
jgi:hypothetical protein